MSEKQTAKTLFRRLPLLNLGGRPFRTTTMTLLVTLLAFVLFGGSALILSLQRGLDSVEARFGADLIAVPAGYNSGMESILLKGEPGYFYMDQAYVEKLSQIDGISQVSAQFYLTSTGAACCAFPVQLIGFDPATDFSIQPWVRQSYGGELTEGALLVGSDIQVPDSGFLNFFGEEYPVAAQLDKTGTGLDSAVYANMDTLRDLMETSIEKGFHFLEDSDPDAVVSSVLIKTAAGYSTETVAHNIRMALDDVQLVETQNMISGISDSLSGISDLLYLFIGAFAALSAAMLIIVFSVTANERKKEFAVIRVLGATRGQLVGLLLKEAVMVSAGGGLIGISTAALIVFPFNAVIGRRLGLPYLMPNAEEIIRLLLTSFAITFAAGPLSAALAAWRIGHLDASVALREGE